MKKLFLSSVFGLFGICCYGQYNQNTNVNQNSTVIHNFPITERVIEKPVYVEKYRTVYVDRPAPRRVAKKLSAPLVLHGYLYVYTEDIGNFKSQRDALEIIGNINAQAPFGRNNWRIPTSAELSVMEQNAAAVGLGDDIYIATDHANGVLRMVSTGPTVAELNEQQRAGVLINGVRWALSNVGSKGMFVANPQDSGNYYTFDQAQAICPTGWRTPTIDELQSLVAAGSEWTTLNGVEGRRFGSDTNFIFLPAAGFRKKSDGYTSVSYQSSIGYYWSLNPNDDWMSLFLYFDGTNVPSTYAYLNSNALAVRCVRE
jgi:uncharacterized protein (TIGR02145 family)